MTSGARTKHAVGLRFRLPRGMAAAGGRTALCLGAGALLLAGCATQRLESARDCYYAGQFEVARTKLNDLPPGVTDRVLFLMERGMAEQAAHDFRASVTDWQAAAEIVERLDYLSVSKGSSSLIINDRVLAFRGAPYERTLLHAFAAKSYMALALWDDAAVEARRVVQRLEDLEGFPDDAYSRYVAGFCFEMIGDADGAALEYAAADKLLEGLRIAPRTGHIDPQAPQTSDEAGRAAASASAAPFKAAPGDPQPELVCFVLIGGAAGEDAWRRHGARWGPAPYAEIYARNLYLGRSYAFSSTPALFHATEERLAARKTAKTAARIAVKETLAHQAAQQNDLLGDVTRLLLYALEAPDTRRWETLPLHLQVARMPCPAPLRDYTVVFRNTEGGVVGQQTVAVPITRRGRIWTSFCRGL